MHGILFKIMLSLVIEASKVQLHIILFVLYSFITCSNMQLGRKSRQVLCYLQNMCLQNQLSSSTREKLFPNNFTYSNHFL